MQIATAAVLIILGGIVVANLFVDTFPRIYRGRACQGASWRRRFPHESKHSIRHFLHFFAAAFAIREKHALQLRPDDELMSIYRAHNPSRLVPDALEFESLSKELEKKHQLHLVSFWHEHLTLGELFVQFSAAQPSVPPDVPAAASRRQGRG